MAAKKKTAKIPKKTGSIEDELRRIEAEEKAIFVEEKRIEEKEDLLRSFEELGLMRWKSYYILTAGAILLLALTFVTSLWVMNDQLSNMQTSMDTIEAKIDALDVGGVIGNVPAEYFMIAETEGPTEVLTPPGS